MLGFFAYCAAEATTMQWASTYFVEVKGIAADRAAGFAALFYIGITAGRFISGIITDRLGDRKMILLGTGILVCGIFILCLPVKSYTVAFAAFLVIGLGVALFTVHYLPHHIISGRKIRERLLESRWQALMSVRRLFRRCSDSSAMRYLFPSCRSICWGLLS